MASARFGPFRLDRGEGVLFFRDGRIVRIAPKALSVLGYLVTHPGRMISKAELLERFWSHRRLGDDVLEGVVREIRVALEDTHREPRYVQTVRGKGYRFVAPVVESTASPALQAPGDDEPALIGRRSALAALDVAFAGASRGERRVVFISGEVGIGKTALLETFVAVLEQREPRSRPWLARGQCIAHYGIGEPYMPLLEALGRLCREPGGEELVSRLIQHAPTWAVELRSLLGAAELASVRERVTGAAQGRMVREFGDFLEACSLLRPCVLAIDDLQWADTSTLELLGYLMRRRPIRRWLLIATRRSETLPVAAGLTALELDWRSAEGFEELVLAPLSLPELEELVARRFLRPSWANSLARGLYQRTGGNPLFAVSALDDLIAQRHICLSEGRFTHTVELDSFGVPTDLAGFLGAFLTRAPVELHAALWAASAIGTAFDAATLGAALGKPASEAEVWAETLRRRGLFARLRPETLKSALTPRYGFSHPLFQQVLYERLEEPERRALHARIAKYGAEQSIDTHPPAALALHFERAGELSLAVHQRARAGELAHARHADPEAAEHFRQALAMLAGLPDTEERRSREIELLLQRGQPLINTLGFSDPEVERTYRTALDLCERSSAEHSLFPAKAGLYKFFIARGDMVIALKLARELHSLAETLQARPLRLIGRVTVGIALYFEGELDPSRRELAVASALYDPAECRGFAALFGDDPHVGGLGFSARCDWLLGHEAPALFASDASVELARSLGHPNVIVVALVMAAELHAWRGDSARAGGYARELSDLAEAQGFSGWSALARFLLCWSSLRSGTGGTLAELRSAFARYEAGGLRNDYAMLAALLAGEHERLYDPLPALPIVERVRATASTSRVWLAELDRLHGELLRQKDRRDSEVSRRHFERALAAARRYGAAVFEARALESAGRVRD